jgi:hypothetical protein
MTATHISIQRPRLAAGLAATLVALALAAPAQAELVGGVRDGGCLQGVQVGTAHDGHTPICRIVR